MNPCSAVTGRSLMESMVPLMGTVAKLVLVSLEPNV